MHPERDLLVALEIEQHALTFRQVLDEHEAAFAFGVVGRKLDVEGVHAGLGDDLDGRLAGRLRGRPGEDRGAKGDDESGGKTRRRLGERCKGCGERR